MFTGLVQAVSRVVSLESIEAGRRLVIDAPAWEAPIRPGDSIAVDGCCLTLAPSTEHTPESGRLAFDVIPETLSKTTLGALTTGDEVNLEPSLRAGDPIGGHFVQGHIDGVGHVLAVQNDPSDWRLRVHPPEHIMNSMVPKGSIALAGVSLTLAALGTNWVEVALIPTTIAETTLGRYTEDAPINVEADVLTKAVAHLLAAEPQR
ncbi:MAG: riboflavin synthase [Planctomycetota bacterium]